MSIGTEIDKALFSTGEIEGINVGSDTIGVRIGHAESEFGGYGEAPQVIDALKLALSDYSLNSGIELDRAQLDDAGQADDAKTISALDSLLAEDGSFNAVAADGNVSISLDGWQKVPNLPKDIKTLLRENKHEVTYIERGITYVVSHSTDKSRSANIRVLHNPADVDPWKYRYFKLGNAATFFTATTTAFKSFQREVR